MPDQPLVNSDLQSALTDVRQAYIDRNPKSFARQQEAMEAMPGGNTRTTLHNAPAGRRAFCVAHGIVSCHRAG